MIDMKVNGLADLKKTLQALPAAIQSQVLRGMVSTGAAIIKNEAKARAPMWTGETENGHPPPGTLKKAIYQTRLVPACTPTREVWKVDVYKGKTKTVRGADGNRYSADAYYASWVEFGHYARVPKAAGKTYKIRSAAISAGSIDAKWIAARPYMRPAFESKKQAAVEAMGTYLTYKLADAVKFAKG